MWYVQIDDTILPKPFQFFSDCLAECEKIRSEMIAVCVNPIKL